MAQNKHIISTKYCAYSIAGFDEEAFLEAILREFHSLKAKGKHELK